MNHARRHIMPDHSARIAQIEQILRSGVTSSSVDGTQITIDHESLRKELRKLRAEDDVQRLRRPRISSVDLSRLF